MDNKRLQVYLEYKIINKNYIIINKNYIIINKNYIIFINFKQKYNLSHNYNKI